MSTSQHPRSDSPVTARRRPMMTIAACAMALSGVLGSNSPVQAQVCATPGSSGDATVSGTINTYRAAAPGTYGAGATTISLSGQRGAAATLAAGDLVLVIQMQCANINTNNGLNYGDGAGGEPASGYTDPAGSCLAGRYQFVRAGAGTSNAVLNLTGSPLTATYVQANATATAGRRTMQIIRVPQYSNLTLGGTVTAADWDGNSGGIVVLDAAFTLNFNGQTINVDGLGFRGGAGRSRSANDAVRAAGMTTPAMASRARASLARRDSSASNAIRIPRPPVSPTLARAWGGYPTGAASAPATSPAGAPGTAGGGGAFWDGASDNGGGGGGGNGGAGGRGGAGWRSAGYAGVLADYSNLTDKKWGFGGTGFLGAAASPGWCWAAVAALATTTPTAFRNRAAVRPVAAS